MKTEPELTPEEEERFDALFEPQDRYSLSYDWKSQLLEAVDEHRAADEVDAAGITTLPPDVDTVVTDLSERRRSRIPVLLVAAVVLVAVGIGTALLVGGASTSTGGLQELPLLDATREVEAPEVTSANAPEGTTAFLETANGDVVAVVEEDGSEETTFYRSASLTEWELISPPLPLVDAVAEVSGETWYVVGGDAESIVDLDLGPGTRFASDVAVFSSTDQGASWDAVDIAIGERQFFEGAAADRAGDSVEFPTEFQSPGNFSIARLGDEVAITYDALTRADWNTFGRDFGIIEDDERMFPVINGSNTRDVFIVGPDRFELRTLRSEDIGLETGLLDETGGQIDIRNLFFQRFPGQQQHELQRLSDSGFVPVNFPTSDSSVTVVGEETVLIADDDQFQLVEFFSGNVWVSPDASTWDLLESSTDDFTDEFIDRADWRVRLRIKDDASVLLEQTTNSDEFSPVPLPALEAQVETGFETDFGGAAIWQDLQANSLRSSRSVVSNNGYEFEIFDNFTVTVTDPSGEVISERQSRERPPQDSVLADQFFNITVFGDDGGVLATVTPEDLEEAFFISGIRAENPPARFVTWATGPDDWRFAELTGLNAALWLFQPTENGLLASAIHDASQALLIDWPDQFGE